MAKWKLQDEQQLIHRKKGTEKVRKRSSGKGKSTGKKSLQTDIKILLTHQLIQNTPYTLTSQQKIRIYAFKLDQKLILLDEVLSLPQKYISQNILKSSRYSKFFSLIWSQP